jgi:hypothetical protein
MVSRDYGDLAPASDFANIGGCPEAMMAQVHLAVVVARLVGPQASQMPRVRDGTSCDEIDERRTCGS